MSEYGPLDATSQVPNEPTSRTPAQPDPIPPIDIPGASAVVDAGFQPLEELTGVTWIVTSWPAHCRRSLPEARADRLAVEQGAPVWFVQSPWPSLSPAQVISLIWANLPRDTEEAWPDHVAEIFAWTEQRAQEEFSRALDE